MVPGEMDVARESRPDPGAARQRPLQPATTTVSQGGPVSASDPADDVHHARNDEEVWGLGMEFGDDKAWGSVTEGFLLKPFWAAQTIAVL